MRVVVASRSQDEVWKRGALGDEVTSCDPMRQSILCQSRADLGWWQWQGSVSGRVGVGHFRLGWRAWCCARASTDWRPGAHDRVGRLLEEAVHGRAWRLHEDMLLNKWGRKSSWGTACKTGNGSREKTFRRLTFFLCFQFVRSPKNISSSAKCLDSNRSWWDINGLSWAYRGWQWKLPTQGKTLLIKTCFFWPVTNWRRNQKKNQPPKSFFPTSIPCLASCASRRFPHSSFQHRPPFQSMSSCSRRALPCTASARSCSRMGPHAAWFPSTSHHQVPPSSTLENEKQQPRGSLAGGNSEQNCCSKDWINSSKKTLSRLWKDFPPSLIWNSHVRSYLVRSNLVKSPC